MKTNWWLLFAALFPLSSFAQSGPSASTSAATAVQPTSATLNGSVTPKGAVTTANFEWGTTTNYGSVLFSANLARSTTPTTIQTSLGNLSPGQTYHYRAMATNSVGVAFGNDVTFTTPLFAAVSAGSVTNITLHEATLLATVTANGLPTTGYFEWGTTTNYTDTTEANTFAPSATDAAMSFTLTNLASGMTYYFRAVVTNDFGVIHGPDGSFTTGMLPSVGSIVVTNITPTSATVMATVSPNGYNGQAFFEWGQSSGYGIAMPVTNFNALDSSVSLELTLELTPGTTYHIRLVATNDFGATFGEDTVFTTKAMPFATTTAATNITAHSAALTANIQPNGNVGVAFFEWGQTSNSYTHVTDLISFVDSDDLSAFLINIDGLEEGTTYHYRVGVSNQFGFMMGHDVSLTTAILPSLIALPASEVLTDRATLHGTITANGNDTSGYFEWGTTTNLGQQTETQLIGSNEVDFAISSVISNLTAGGTYYFRLVATNTAGSVSSTALNFTCLAPPVIVSVTATNFIDHSALLTGQVAPNGLDATAFYEWGTTTNYGTQTAPTLIPVTVSLTNIDATLSGLEAGMVYHYRLVASSEGGITYGADASFFTGPVVSTQPPINVRPNSATFQAWGFSNNQVTSYYFEYGETTNYGSTTLVMTPSIGTINIGLDVTNLLQSTTYHYRAVASNEFATVLGDDVSFTTTGGPTVTTPTITFQPGGVAVFSADVVANQQDVSAFFKWGTSTLSSIILSNKTPVQLLAAGTNAVTVTTTVSNLVPGQYIGCIILASNQLALTQSPPVTTRIADVPTILSSGTGYITNTYAYLTATASTLASGGLFYFDWGTTTNYGNRTANANFFPETPMSYSNMISPLISGVYYHFRAVASNSVGVTFGPDKVFLSRADPIVTTGSASSIGYTNALLNGTVTANGLSTFVYMEYGTTTNYGSATTFTNIGTNRLSMLVSQSVSNLLPGFIYNYRVVAANESATVYGANKTFSTSLVFSNINLSGLPTYLQTGGAAVADFNNDGRLDFVITGGSNGVFYPCTGIYTNTGAVSTDKQSVAFNNANSRAKLPPLVDSSVVCADFNNDGRIDIAISGRTNSSAQTGITRIYRNDGGGNFSDMNAGFVGIFAGSLSAVDFNNDGKMDLLVCGQTNSSPYSSITRLYQNNGDGTFTASAPFPNCVARATWEDYNNDGYFDVLLAGTNAIAGTNMCTLFRNNGNGTFAAVTNLSIYSGASGWGDYDADGRMDLFLGTPNFYSPTNGTRLFRNSTSAGFQEFYSNLSLPAATGGAWADYDNDGVLDLLVAGWAAGSTSSYQTTLAHGSGNGTFTSVNSGITNIFPENLQWADFNNDGRLDVLGFGRTYYSGFGSCAIYRSSTVVSNTPPSAPAGLSAAVIGNRVMFRWDAATDAQTPTAALTYNLRIGTTPGGNEIMSCLSDTNGFRRVAMPGNVRYSKIWTLNNLPLSGTFYWSVQAVDAGFLGSSFATEQKFIVPGAPTVIPDAVTNITFTSATLNGFVDANGFGTTSHFEWGTTTSYGSSSSLIFSASNAATAQISATLTSLQQQTTYHWRIVATNSAGITASADQVFTIPAAPIIYSESATNITQTWAELSVVLNARGNSGTVSFEYGLTPSLGFVTGGLPVIGSNQTTAVFGITNLQAGHLYYYRARIITANGTIYAATQSFTTQGTLAFTGTTIQTNGGFTLQFSGSNGTTYDVYGSSNLITWDLLGQATVTNGACEFIDMDSTNNPSRFYRLQLP